MSETNRRTDNWSLRRFIPERQNLVLLIVPLFFFTFMLFRLAEIHFFYQAWIDPVYAYLMNGLTFALGSNDIGHVDHPGTPLQLFCALMIRLVGLMRGTNDLATDVLTNPETYLRVISIALITLNCLLLWMMGFFAFKNLKNRNMAIVLQLIPLMTFQVMNFMAPVACESVVTLLSFAIAACMILYDSRIQARPKLLIVIAVLSALMISTKVSTLLILIVPFFFFENIKSKVNYLLLTLLLIVIFISPVLDKLGAFTSFIGKMATHTGKYGSGEHQLFDRGIYFGSLREMIAQEVPFTLHLLLLPIGWLVISKQNIQGSLKRLYLAITLATVFQVLIVARHYSFHYLMPVFALFMPLHGYFWFQLFRDKINALSTRIVFLMVMALVIGVFSRLIVLNNFEKGIINPLDKTTQAIHSTWGGKYIILSDYNNDAAMIDPAFRFGLSYSGQSMRPKYASILASIYPGNYLWNSRDGFSNWSNNYLAPEIFSRNPQIYIYANTESCEVAMMKISDMIDQSGMTEYVKLKNVYQNDKKGEVIALALVDTARISKFNHPKMILETAMEELSTDGSLLKSNNVEYTFKGGKLQSDRFARSGSKSLLFTSSNQFGLNISLPVSLGKSYKVEFWQRSSDQKQAVVVASGSTSEIFYKTSRLGTNHLGEWVHSELNVALPANFPESNLNFYLYNPTSDSVWVDDLKVMIF